MNEQHKVLNGISINLTKDSILLGKHNESAVNELHRFIEREKGGIMTVFSKETAGKTHLVQAAGNELWDRNVPVNYTTTESFDAFPQWPLNLQTVRSIGEELERIYYKSHRSGCREILYKANLNRVADYIEGFYRRKDKYFIEEENDISNKITQLTLKYCYPELF